jgi:hypothetical protein
VSTKVNVLTTRQSFVERLFYIDASDRRSRGCARGGLPPGTREPRVQAGYVLKVLAVHPPAHTCVRIATVTLQDCNRHRQ